MEPRVSLFDGSPLAIYNVCPEARKPAKGVVGSSMRARMRVVRGLGALRTRRVLLLVLPMACAAALFPAAGGSVSRLRLTMQTSPNPAVAGKPVTISGHLVGGAVGGVPVVLWRRLPNQRGFRVAGRSSTDANGAYRFVVRPGVIQAWYVSATGLGGGALNGSGGSQVTRPGPGDKTVLERVRANVTLVPSDARPTPGEKVRLSGSVSPSYAAQPITLQMRSGGHWRTMTKARLNR